MIGLGVILAVCGLLIFSNAIHNWWPYEQPRPLPDRSVARGEDVRRRLGDEVAERFFTLRRQSLDRATRRAPIWIGVSVVITVAGGVVLFLGLVR